MARKLPPKLANNQQNARKETQTKIQDAIDVLKSLGYENISLSQIAKEANLARATLDKAHAIEILKKNQIGKYKNKAHIVNATSNLNDKEIIGKLEKELIRCNEKIGKLEKELATAKQKLTQKKLQLIEKDQELSGTIGNFQALYEKVISLGIKITL